MLMFLMLIQVTMIRVIYQNLKLVLQQELISLITDQENKRQRIYKFTLHFLILNLECETDYE